MIARALGRLPRLSRDHNLSTPRGRHAGDARDFCEKAECDGARIINGLLGAMEALPFREAVSTPSRYLRSAPSLAR